MPRTVTTKQFNKYLSALKMKGKKGKDAIMKTKSALADAGMNGKIELKRTNHGESRLSNVEKFDLGDGYRLVVQVIDTAKQERAFLFVGDHEDADHWLERHKDYQWVLKDSDQTLDFVQVSVPEAVREVLPDFDLDSPESVLDLPLLRDVSDKEWGSAKVDVSLREYLQQIPGTSWEQDPQGILTHIETKWSLEDAIFVDDVLVHAHRREWDEMHRRFELRSGAAHTLSLEEAGKVMTEPQNSERFVTWSDLAQLPQNVDWAEWMLFLHPEQKEFVDKVYNGPARLRGVSGSGKTCVMIHRARQLAKRYREKVLLITLTESMRKLLEKLVAQLCHSEAGLISCKTMTAFAREALYSHLRGTGAYYQNTGDKQNDPLLRDALRSVTRNSDFGDTVLAKMSEEDLKTFVDSEISYVRTRFLPEEYPRYLTVQRHGRSIALPEKARSIILEAVKTWDAALQDLRTLDFESTAQTALQHLVADGSNGPPELRYRCVLVDEVQDLSQIELRILASVYSPGGTKTSELEDGLFLVGDGAQTIYQRGFSLKACGISVANRSFVLKKNYRNTREILEAAYGLIKEYEFADVDEDNIGTPTAPDLSSRHGEKPLIVKCVSEEQEEAFVVAAIREMLEAIASHDDAEEHEHESELPICVIGFNSYDRSRLERALEREGIPTKVLKEDIAWDGNDIKISTLESAKGHEFHAVFIVGVHQGTIPHQRVAEKDWHREAARLYVAMTRARDRLFITYSASKEGRPSVFLAAIQPDCQECTYGAAGVAE